MSAVSGNNISLPDPLLAQIQSAAESERRSAHELVSEAVKRYLEDRSWTSLLEYGAQRARDLGIDEAEIDRRIAESRAEQRQA